MHLVEIGLAFIEGVALIASPCILPVLPLILSTSVDGGRRRPFGVVTGFVLAFTIFALVSRELVAILHINLDYIKYGSLILLAFFGIVMLSEKLSSIFSSLTQNFATTGTTLSANARDGFLSGVLIGSLIGLVWTPCAGPILAVALVQIIREQNDLAAVFLVFAFAIGAGLPMLIISLTGRKLMTKLNFLNTHAGIIRKILGVLILIVVGFIASGLNAATIFSSPSTTTSIPTIQQNQLQNGLANPYKAPQFAPSDIWINTPNNKPITMDSLKGMVVLVDFWTYSCINCVRTLPAINSWYKKYHANGLVIIGVHAPEFEFEKNKENVMKAIATDHIQYPVALDNNLDTWTNFNNQYWPAHYLIDTNGNVVYTSFGEGNDAITENNIRLLLGLGTTNLNEPLTNTITLNQTPETYLGYQRNEAFARPEGITQNQISTYTFPSFLPSDNWALSGKWLIREQHIVSTEANTKLELNFTAKHVYLVLGSANDKAITLRLKLNGKTLGSNAGVDSPNGILRVKEHRLYELINQTKAANALLEIDVDTPGLEAYAFTFGSK